MSKGLHKNSLREGEPNKWIVEDTIEQIRAEVERRKLDGLEHGLTFVPTAMQSLLEFLDTLQEQPVCEGLEEEIESYISENGNIPYLASIARHFAQWQKEKDNEVADKALTMSIKLQEGWYAKGIADGEKSMKEQMMKNAVEGEVIDDGEVVVPALRTILSKMDDGDKVRIVIVKEDEK